MDERLLDTSHDDRHRIALWTALTAGPAAAALHLPVSYALVKFACGWQRRTPLLLEAVGALLLASAGVWLAWTCEVRWRAIADEQGNRPDDRSLFLARVALGTNLTLALFIAGTVVATLVLSPCE